MRRVAYISNTNSDRAGVTHHGRAPKEAVATARAKVGARAVAWLEKKWWENGGKNVEKMLGCFLQIDFVGWCWLMFSFTLKKKIRDAPKWGVHKDEDVFKHQGMTRKWAVAAIYPYWLMLIGDRTDQYGCVWRSDTSKSTGRSSWLFCWIAIWNGPHKTRHTLWTVVFFHNPLGESH